MLIVVGQSEQAAKIADLAQMLRGVLESRGDCGAPWADALVRWSITGEVTRDAVLGAEQLSRVVGVDWGSGADYSANQ